MKLRKFTRRQMAGALAGAVAMGTAAPAAQEDPGDLRKEAAARNEENIRALDKAALPMATEPAAVFRTL